MSYAFTFDLTKLSQTLFEDIVRISEKDKLNEKLANMARNIVNKFNVDEHTGLPISDSITVIEDLIHVNMKNRLYNTMRYGLEPLLFRPGELRNSTKRIINKNTIRPLYLVPMARPQRTAAMTRCLMREKSACHLKSCMRPAVEKKMSPRSTYTVIESFTTTGMDKKNRTPAKA